MAVWMSCSAKYPEFVVGKLPSTALLILLEVGRLEVRSILSTEISIGPANSKHIHCTGSVPEVVEADANPDRTIHRH